MTSTTSRVRRVAGRWPLWLLAAPAAVSIWAGWVGLGQMCGYGLVHPLPGIADQVVVNTAVTLPVGMEAYAAYALGAWLSPKPLRAAARTFAKRSALTALGLGLLGQATYHLLRVWGYVRAPWPVVLFVSALPVLVLGAGAALHHLLADPDTSAAEDNRAGVVDGEAVIVEPGGLSRVPTPSGGARMATGKAPTALPGPEFDDTKSAEPAPAAVPAARIRRGSGPRRGRKPAPRRLLADYLVEARGLLVEAPPGTDPSPSWCQRVTGCSDGTSVKLARALRTELLTPGTTAFPMSPTGQKEVHHHEQDSDEQDSDEQDSDEQDSDEQERGPAEGSVREVAA